jgi:hypothetical protein
MQKKIFFLFNKNALDRVTKAFEVLIAIMLLIVITLKFVDLILPLFQVDLVLIKSDFETIMSGVFALVIGIEFTKMLCKHTPETVIDVLLFAIARQMVMSNKGATDMLIGVAAIAGIFAAKKYLLDKKKKVKEEPFEKIDTNE